MPTLTYEPIATYTLGSTASSLTFSSIPQTYTNLVLVGHGSLDSATQQAIRLQFNGDTGTSYYFYFIFQNLSATGVTGSAGVTYGNIAQWVNVRGNVVCDIFDYTNTSKKKTYLSYGGYIDGSTSLQNRTHIGTWNQSAAINSITVLTLGNMIAGTTFTLFGVAG